jgi:acetolactate synthase I/II/III large subunit
MKVATYLARFLRAQGVTHVYELVGGMITFMLDAIYQENEANGGAGVRGALVRIVSVHHEQGAAFAADAAGRMTGIPGVAMGTSGPGATNLLTGIGSCYFDSSPAVFITGQVNRSEQKGARDVRQLGFQETDIVSMAKPITKAAWLVNDPEQIPALLHQAFELAISGRPGPVLLDIPMDVQRAEIGEPNITRVTRAPLVVRSTDADAAAFLDKLQAALTHAQRPLILAGGGIGSSHTFAQVRALARRLHVPLVNSLMAVDAMPHDDPLHVGMIGSYGNRWANLAIGAADMLIVLGSRLDVRQTGALAQEFKGEKPLFHVDAQAGEMNNRVQGCETLHADLPWFFAKAQDYAWQRGDTEAWLDQLHTLEAAHPDTAELTDIDGINPNAWMHALSAASGAAAAYVVDVGQHQMWAAQSLDLRGHQRFLTSGGMGSMGFALPAAIGAAFASGQPVVMIAGDGGFQCNIQELQTIVRNRLPIKLVVLNNGTHGMVRQFQQAYFHERYQSTLWGYDAPNFEHVATAYGIAARTITTPEQMADGAAWLWQDPHAPALLQVMIDTYANAYPKIAFGQPITGMEPQYKPLEMEGT